MAEMGWTTRVTTAAGVAAGTGAAQLGLGYGLGVVVWPVTATTDESVWLGSLGWATWITASATVFGAVIGSRLGGTPATRPRGPWRAVLAASAGVGALVAVALIALPARAAVRTEAHPPSVIAAAYALVGLLLGVLVAYWAVVSRPVAANLIATAAWLWGLAVAAIVVELTTDRTSATYLTSWQFAEAATGGRYGAIYWPSALLTLIAALVIGIVAATPAVRRGHLSLGTATSGAVGPLLVAASFLALSPRFTGNLGPIESAYLIAPYAVLAGLGGSAVTVTAGQALATRRARREGRSPAAAIEAMPAADPEPAIARTGASVVADTPAADPDTIPGGATPRKGFRRAKLPTQPSSPADSGSSRSATPTQAPANSGQGSPAGPGPSAAKPGPASGSGLASGSSPTDSSSRAGGSSAAGGSGVAGGSGPASGSGPATVGNPSTTPPRPSNTSDSPGSAAVSKASGTGRTPTAAAAKPPTPAKSGAAAPAGPSMPGGPARPPQPSRPEPAIGRSTPPPSSAADPEIADAARPGRGRAKKAAPPRKTTDAKDPKSTVTPPPATPTIAQINPKPPPPD